MTTPQPSPSFFAAVKWGYTLEWGDRIFSALFFIILASLLGPQEFGIASIAIMYIAFIQLFLDQGLSTALIQMRDIRQEHSDTVFWLTVVMSVVLSLMTLALSGLWASLNHAAEVRDISNVLSLAIIIEGLSVVQKALLRRQMQFRDLSIRTNTSVIIGGIVGIIAAFYGAGVWSLVIQMLVRDLIAVIVLWKISSWRPRFVFSWIHLIEVFRFSIANFTAQLALYFDNQAGPVALGLLLGPEALGLYRFADRIMSIVLAMTINSIQAVSLSQFSRLQTQSELLKSSVLTCIRMGASVALPALAGLAVVSDPLMAMIGPKWAAASDPLKILSVAGMTMVFTFFTGPMLQALGRSRQAAKLEWGRATIGLMALVVAGLLTNHTSVDTQVLSVSFARLFAQTIIVAPTFVYVLLTLSRIPVRNFLWSAIPSFVASIGVVASVMLVQSSLETIRAPGVTLSLEIVIGGLAGVLILFSLDARVRKFILEMFGKNAFESRN